MWNQVNLKTIKGIRLLACTIAAVWLIGSALQVQATESLESPVSGDSGFAVQGKLFCSLKRYAIMPFKGIIISVPVHSGQAVKKGDILAQYRLASEEMMRLRSRISPLKINELEIQLSQTESDLDALNNGDKELKPATQRNNASATVAAMQIKHLIKMTQHHKELLQEQLRQEKQVLKQEQALVVNLLGKSIHHNTVPEIVSIVSPLDGVVMGIHPELRVGAEIGPISPAFMIGVLNPMIMKAQVYEIEAIRLSLDDRAEISLESLPEHKFDASLSRISLTPITPALDQPSYYEIELTVSNPDKTLRDGLKGQIRFVKNSLTQKQGKQ